MKYAAMVVVLLAVCASGAYADDGQVSKSALADMGLSGLQVMSDSDGMAVRGKFAVVGGFASSSFFGSNGLAAYAAGDFGAGPDFAIGSGVAVSGGAIIFPGGATIIGVTGSFALSAAFAGP